MRCGSMIGPVARRRWFGPPCRAARAWRSRPGADLAIPVGTGVSAGARARARALPSVLTVICGEGGRPAVGETGSRVGVAPTCRKRPPRLAWRCGGRGAAGGEAARPHHQGAYMRMAFARTARLARTWLRRPGGSGTPRTAGITGPRPSLPRECTIEDWPRLGGGLTTSDLAEHHRFTPLAWDCVRARYSAHVMPPSA